MTTMSSMPKPVERVIDWRVLAQIEWLSDREMVR